MANILNEKAMQQEAQMELTRREMERKSLDTVRIYNPLDRTFYFMYNSYWHNVGAKSYKDEPRYLAHHFFKKMCDAIIGAQMIEKGESLKALREKQFGMSFVDKYQENKEVWDKVPRMDDPDLVKQIKKLVIIGLVSEYGMDEPDPNMSSSQQRMIDLRSMHDQIFDSGSMGRVDTELPPAPVVAETSYPINKTKLAEEVTI